VALQTVHVLATTPDGTRAALSAGRAFARRRHTHLVLLVTAPDSWETARCLRVARQFDGSITVRVCSGPNTTEAIKHVVPTLALVVIGGPVRRWWPTIEQRMAERLRRHGRDAVFVPEKALRVSRPGRGSSGSVEVAHIQERRARRSS
jgi:hypothetical protein